MHGKGVRGRGRVVWLGLGLGLGCLLEHLAQRCSHLEGRAQPRAWLWGWDPG